MLTATMLTPWHDVALSTCLCKSPLTWQLWCVPVVPKDAHPDVARPQPDRLPRLQGVQPPAPQQLCLSGGEDQHIHSSGTMP